MYDVVVNGEWSMVSGQFPGSVYSRLTITIDEKAE